MQIKELVYLRLRDALIEHEYAPGDSLREVALSARYGVSKTPIREALVRLEHDGLVEIAPYKGARARTYTPDDARELFEARELLESEGLRMTADDPDAIARLRANVEETRSALTAGMLSEVSARLDEFDDLLLAQLDNRLLAGVVEKLTLHLRRLGKLGAGRARFEESIQQHEQIVDALERGDEVSARRVLTAHLGSVAAAQARALQVVDAREQ